MPRSCWCVVSSMNEALRQLPAGIVVFPMKTRVWLAANCTTVCHDKSNSEAGLIVMQWIEQLWHVSMELLRHFCYLFCLLRRQYSKLASKKVRKQTRSIREAWVMQTRCCSLCSYRLQFTPYTASSPYSIVTTRRFLHDTTLSFLPLDADSDAVALHDGNLTEELSRAAAIC